MSSMRFCKKHHGTPSPTAVEFPYITASFKGSTRASLYAGTATCAQLLHRLWAKFRIPSAASRRPSSLTKLCFAAVNSTEDASTAGISGSSAGPAARPVNHLSNSSKIARWPPCSSSYYVMCGLGLPS
ncbi:hypothetical protein M513_12036 [Trichuris suis]|uniref:Uncharacterized protein n=1 Tax=Trichuris suis TaxID=68888 RepID=A0A085LQ80_9BILA|nr:hypothetical protein M513_12036 [Trichuris suis]